MRNATPRIAQDGRSAASPVGSSPIVRRPLELTARPYDAAAAGELDGWRPAIRGDPRTCDILDFYALVLPQLGEAAAVAEVGVAWGRGVLFAASVFVQLGWKGARVYAIDPWRGPGDPAAGFSSMHFAAALHSLVLGAAPYEMDTIYPVRIPSPAAAGAFRDASLDLVLIDGCHTHAAVAADIAAWIRVVRAGGILAGHDFTEEFPGVKVAAREAFCDRIVTRGSVWAARV